MCEAGAGAGKKELLGAAVLNNLGIVYVALARYDQAETAYQRAL